METIKQGKLTILKGEKIVHVKTNRIYDELFFEFLDNLLVKDYKILHMTFQGKMDKWEAVLVKE